MISISWLRFEWDLKTLSADELNLPPPFVLTRADKDDEHAVRNVALNSFGMDTGWSDIQRIFAETILRHVQAGFQRSPPDCVIVQHGSRIIGASIVDPSAEAENHLTTGPCVLHEYRGRGVGTALLEASLVTLQQSGVGRAYGVVRDKTAAARFLYRKFGGFGARWSADFEVAQRLAA
jgi:ribosomal protein S18 acetylase RimI-like enzyme